MTRVVGRSRKDRAVKKAQFRFERMGNCEICGHSLFDSSDVVYEEWRVSVSKTQTEGFTVNKAIERAAVSDVEFDRTEARHLDPLVPEINERRHVPKRCFAHLSIFNHGPSVNLAGRH